jgi:hypothetical protein
MLNWVLSRLSLLNLISRPTPYCFRHCPLVEVFHCFQCLCFHFSKLLITLMGFPRLGVAFTPRLHRNALAASFIMCTSHGTWFLNPGHSIAEASSVDCSLHVIKWFKEDLFVVMISKRLSVNLKRSHTYFKCAACLALVCWPLSYHP